jgi:hypothetical protein
MVDRFEALEPQHERPSAEDFGWMVTIETARETGQSEMLVEKLRSGDPLSAMARNWLADLLEKRETPPDPEKAELRWSLLAATRDYYYMDDVEWKHLILKANAKERFLTEDQHRALKNSRPDPILHDRDTRIRILAAEYNVGEARLTNFLSGEGTPAKGDRRALDKLIERAAPKGGM